MTTDQRALELETRQLSLHRALSGLDTRLGKIYLGVLRVLRDDLNPDSQALAAHGVREIMDQLPRYLNVPLKAQAETLKSKARNLEAAWDRAISNSDCHDGATWTGKIDSSLGTLLRRLGVFFEWFKEHRPRRKQEAGKIVRELEPSRRSFPPSLQEEIVSLWMEMRDFFPPIAHHGREVTPAEFDAQFQKLETFLLERLAPRTSMDLDEIDGLIREAKSNDQK